MKKLAMPLFVILLFLCNGCTKKGCISVKPEAEETEIMTFAAANNITAIKHSSGLYYQILDPGSDVSPGLNSTISVTYTGKLLNNDVFQMQDSPITTELSKVIEGWQIGIPLIKKGGRIKLIIPSSYAYGCNGKEGIPSNSVLYFDVSLVDVK